MKPKNTIKKFLEFNGKNIYFISANGTWWIAIKPICEALGIKYEKQRERIKNDKILGQLPTVRGVVAADGKLREMVCLPEFYIYGWLFKIKSSNKTLEEYQWKCYELLYNYFRGSITKREQLLTEQVKAQTEIEKLEEELSAHPTYQRIQQLRDSQRRAASGLRIMDRQFIAEQLTLFQSFHN